MAADGTTALVGAAEDDDTNGRDAGSAYVFERAGGSWRQQTKLAAADGDPGDNFGWSVAVAADGTTALVGASEDEDPNGHYAGSAYVLERSGGSWRQHAKLAPADGDEVDEFGDSVAMAADGSTALVHVIFYLWSWNLSTPTNIAKTYLIAGLIPTMTEDSEGTEYSVAPAARITTVEATPLTAKSSIVGPEEIRKRLDNDEHVLALLLSSTMLEHVMSRGIRESLDIGRGQYETILGNESVGNLGQLCQRLEVFGDEFNQSISDDIAHQRRNLVHDTPEHGFNYINIIEGDSEIKEDVENAIENAVDFIDTVLE